MTSESKRHRRLHTGACGAASPRSTRSGGSPLHQQAVTRLLVLICTKSRTKIRNFVLDTANLTRPESRSDIRKVGLDNPKTVNSSATFRPGARAFQGRRKAPSRGLFPYLDNIETPTAILNSRKPLKNVHTSTTITVI